jgi:iron(III) transport system permease protein
VPGIALGLSLLVVYLRVPFPIYGTLGILLIAYVTKFLPFGMRFATTSMYQVHSDLEESALVAGASWMYTFRRILLPLVAPGIIAGWIYVAMVSVRELSSSVLIYSPGSEVIGVAMWQLSVDTKYNQLAALGILMVLALCVFAFLAQRARGFAGSAFERGGGL